MSSSILGFFIPSSSKLEILKTLGLGQVWVGLDDVTSEGQYVWSDGRLMTSQEWSLWAGGEPSTQRNEDCVVFRGGNREGFNDVKCSKPDWQPVCEIPL